MSLNRRHFLQFAGSTLAALGLSQWDILHQGDRYAQVLAQGTPRKLALLVGINEYPESSLFSSLQGCITDVELQRQLLIHRFGFNPADVLTLTDAKATRQGILSAFEEHLIKQAKAGDVVVFHYSGHGSRVVDPDKDNPDGLNSTLVPVDSQLPPGFPDKSGSVKDIMGHTLFLLMSALQTENVTMVLDSCHAGGAKRGNLRVRSRSGGTQLQADPAEFAYQQQWRSRLNLSPQEFIQQRRAGIAKGVVIASAKRNQLAADAPFSDFFAGAFTYLMTQYLWQDTGTAQFRNAIPNIARSTTKASSSEQEPEYEVKPGSNYNSEEIYFIPKQAVPAEAVITQIKGDRADVWLGGLNPQSLVAFEQDAVLTAVDDQGNSLGQVQLESRSGLVGRGKLINMAKPGALLQEQVRGIPTDLKLKIGLDPSLGSDTAGAKQALQAVNRVQPLPLQQEEVHYILGRMTQDYRKQVQQKPNVVVPVVGSIGLFYPGLDIVPDSFGAVGESVTAAIARLQPKLKSLLAARLVKLTLNTDSSRLNVAVSMTPAGQEKQLLASAFTVRGVKQSSMPATPTNVSDPRVLPLGTAIQLTIMNNEPKDLYFSVLVIDPDGGMSVVFSNQWTASADAMRVGSGQRLSIPDPSRDTFNLVVQEPKGTTEVLVVASTAPLGKALKALQGVATRGGQTRGPVGLGDPTEMIGDLLDDLGSATRGGGSGTASSGIRRIDTSQMAALSITFEVV